CFIDASGVLRKTVKEYEVEGFYVHPVTRLLCFKRKPSKRVELKAGRMARSIEEVPIDRMTSYRLLEGQWYLVTHCFYKIGRGCYLPIWDVASRREVQLSERHNRVAVSKRQCNHAEIAKIMAWIEGRRKQIRRM